MKKVLIHTNLPSPYRVDFFNALAKQCDVEVVFERKKAKNRNNKWYNDGDVLFKAKFLKGIRYGDEEAFSLGLARKMCFRRKSILVVSGYSSLTAIFALVFMKLFRKKYILNVDGAIAHPTQGFKKKLKSMLIRGAAAYMSTSRVTDEYLMSFGAEKSRIFRYHFTSLKEADLQKRVVEAEEKAALRDKLNVKESKMFLAVGSYIHRKGFDVLLKASERLPKGVGIYIVGGTPTEEYVKLREDLNLTNVHFVEHLNKEELKVYYKAADLCVFPTRYDIWGLVVVEALGYGLPVLTTDQCVAGLELIQDGYNGFIVPAGDEKALHERMAYILDTKWLSRKVSENVLESIQLYTIENMVKEYCDVFAKF